MNEKLVGCYVVFKGMVQGVGFRFTAKYLAGRYSLKGYVKNLPDGSVELELEGDKPTIENFLNSLEDEMRGYIREKEVTWKDYSGKFSSFQIRF